LASSAISAALAAPFSGKARTRTSRTARPSGARPVPSIRSAEDFGVSRTRRTSPASESSAKSGWLRCRPGRPPGRCR
jgi:hypothetical protein